MSTNGSLQEARRVYRIDKFNVPGAARQEFMDRVRGTHQFLRTLPGFIEDSVLEQIGGPGEFNLITIAVWEGPEAFEAARKAVMARYEETGFKPQALMARLGIKGDLANYSPIDI